MREILIRMFYFACGALFGATVMTVVAVGADGDRDDDAEVGGE